MSGGLMLNAALTLADEGLAVFPLHAVVRGICGCKAGKDCPFPGKHPDGELAPRGHLTATTDRKMLSGWWTTSPNANVGVRTGWYDGRGWLVGLDLDRGPGEPDGLRALELLREGRALPSTRTTLTPSGGRHLLYWSEQEIRGRVALVPGIDVKAVGGYLVAPPSRAANGGGYKQEGRSQIAALPAWLRDFVARERPSAAHRRRSTVGRPARSDRDWGGVVGVLASWDTPVLVEALAAKMNVGTDRFVPPSWWRKSDTPSLEWFNDGEACVLMDHGAAKHGTLASFSLAEVYAAQRTHIVKRLGSEQAAWKSRMLIELGFLEAYAWTPPPAPPDLRPLDAWFYELLVEVTTCRWTLEADAPVLCSLPFAKHWDARGPIGKSSIGGIGAARAAIIGAGLYEVVGHAPSRAGGRPSPLMLPAGWPR